MSFKKYAIKRGLGQAYNDATLSSKAVENGHKQLHVREGVTSKRRCCKLQREKVARVSRDEET